MSDLKGGSEELTRADKINRIKNSMHQENSGSKAEKAPDVPDWEKKINSILAKKEQKPANSGAATAESILAEIYGDELFSSSKADEPEIVPEPEPEVIPEPEPEVAPESEQDVASESEPEVAPESEQDVVSESEPEVAPVSEPEIVPESEPKITRKMKKNKPEKKKKKKKSIKQRFLGLFPQKGDSVLEIIRKIIFLVSIIAIVVCGYLVADYYIDLWKSKKVTEEMRDIYWSYETTEHPENEKHPVIQITDEGEPEPVYTMLPGAAKLLEVNKDVIGYIKIDGTPVDNVVLRAKDNFVYLDKKINGEENRAGELFLDWRNHFDDVDDEGHLKVANSQNLVIYGHAMKDQSMFGCLIKYRTADDYYSEHPVIYLNSNYSHYTYKIFAVFILDAEDKSETRFDCWNKLNFSDEDDFYNFVNEAKRRTIRTNEVDVKYGDELLTLSTCDDYLKDRGRLIVMARRVREGEDPYSGTKNSKRNPNIKWPTMYYNTNSGEHYDPENFVPYNADEKKENTGDNKEKKPEEKSESAT